MPKPVIFGLSGPSLSDEERRFFARSAPLGFILFARNCQDPDQLRALVDALRETIGREDAPVLIDQEGGRVARLGPPHWRRSPPAAPFGALAARDFERAERAVRLNAGIIAFELAALGIDVDCAPVLDVPVAGSHEIIGDRAFSSDPDLVARLGRAAMEGFLDAGVIPVIKHIPGHGRAGVDSHRELPVVDTPLDELRRTDFAPFAALADAPWAMSAHVVYRAIDPGQPASVSAKVIEEIIRGEIGFDGVLVSDDLGMEALSGDFAERAGAALAAGCDVALHCSGVMAEMREVDAALGEIGGVTRARLERARGMLRQPGDVDLCAMVSQLADLMAVD
ncbi:MAG: beta-N-acetylhexosaminidase [Alphaproteobacteria bacterium]